MLHYLMIHAGEAIPQTELLKSVWGPEHGNDFEYLRTYVGQLRKKIEDDPLKPQYIQTLPRIGYRFNLEHKEA
jgi:two-component system KDP operon response regulator KdpE